MRFEYGMPPERDLPESPEIRANVRADVDSTFSRLAIAAGGCIGPAEEAIPGESGEIGLHSYRIRASSGGWVSRNDLETYLAGRISVSRLLSRTVSGSQAASTDLRG